MKKYFSILLATLILFTYSCTEKRSSETKVLVFAKTAGYHHESIAKGLEALTKLGQDNGFSVDTTVQASKFNEENLKQYGAVIFLNTTGNVLDVDQETAFERYIQAGGGYVGVHAAADTEYDWKWYGGLAGAYFKSHPAQAEATFNIVDKDFGATDFFKESTWVRWDELYNYKDISPDINVLITIDESTYEGGENPDHHPMAWYHEYDGGRAFYTALGHTDESYEEELFLKHLLGGIEYAIGSNAAGDYNKAKSQYQPQQDRFSKVQLAYGQFYEPTEMTILPNFDILITQRRGEILKYSAEDNNLKQVGLLDVYHESGVPRVNAEEGVMGLCKDPNYASNNWVYIFYAPKDTSVNRLSRFTFKNDTIDQTTEKIVLELYSQRKICCHTGGSIAFGPDNTLYLSTGDNSTPFNDRDRKYVNSGFAPLNDDEVGKQQFDARRSSGNTNDLRGKVLRIKMNDDATYDIPEGNLFPVGMEKTRPEIYTMGHRNPYRISVDSKDGTLYWGDVGPDSGQDSLDTRGPRGYDEVGQARTAGNYGWPLFVGNNYAYRDYNYMTGESGDFFDALKPINNSKNNTGLEELPPARPAMIWYPSGASTDFPQVGTGGRNPMTGPVYYVDDYPEETRLPDYYDGKLIIYEWIRGWIKAVTFDDNGDFAKLEPFFDDVNLNNLIDMEVGPDGRLYLLEYGSGWFSKNANSTLARIDYNYGNRPPKVNDLMVDKAAGNIPYTVEATIDAVDLDGDPITYEWDFGDGMTEESTSNTVKHTYTSVGDYDLSVVVKDDKGGAILSENKALYAGNENPKVEIVLNSANKSFYIPGTPLEYKVNVTDEGENTTFEPENLKVQVDYLAGFDLAAIDQGHFEGTTGGKGKSLTQKLDCLSCHKVDSKSIGPNYTEVSLKYLDDEDGQTKITNSIINGSVGAWGENQMPPHATLDPDDANAIADWILSLAEEVKDVDYLPKDGSITPPEDVEERATLILSASYTDIGGEGIKALSGSNAVYLKSNTVRFTGDEEIEEFNKLSFGNNNFFGLANVKGWVGMEPIDLTGVGSLEIVCSYRNAPDVGIDFEVHLDAPDGPMLGKGSMETPEEDSRSASAHISINQIMDGKMHKIYIVNTPRTEEEDGPGVSIRAVKFGAAGVENM